MNEIYKSYKDRVDFYLVYIREAHPSDGWQIRANLDDKLEYLEPRTEDERAKLAGVCMIDLGFEMPMLLDNMDNEEMAVAVALRNEIHLQTILEASGGITLDRVPSMAGLGLDYISVGAITHSAGAIDIGLDFDAEVSYP